MMQSILALASIAVLPTGNEKIFYILTQYISWLVSCVPGRDEDDAAGARHAGEAEQPQEDSVQNHRHVFPVVRHLGGTEM